MATDRREALKIISAIGATCTYPFASDELYGQSATPHVHETAPPAALPAKPVFFDEAGFRVISTIADLIIPATDTPGAIGAGVPFYIDMVISRSKLQQQLAKEGLQWLAAKNFSNLDAAGQLAILEPLCEASDAGHVKERPVQFFQLIKGLTADGYYTSQTGLIQELGYSGNTVLSAYPECVHEH